MNVLILGGSGFIGTRLTRYLLDQGQKVVSIATRLDPGRFGHPDFTHVSADTTQKGDWQGLVPKADVVVNLAGRTIFHLWTDAYKQQIRFSRIRTTQNLVEAMDPAKPATLINASAVGYYGQTGEKTLDESAGAGDDFLAKVALDWEKEARKAADKGARVALARFGVVLGAGGGAMAKMLPAFKLGLGGVLGNGGQWFPWIHVDDLVSALDFIARRPDLSGPFNFCAPQAVSNRELAETLAAVVSRPAFFRTPAFLIRAVLGDLGQMLLTGQKAAPKALLDAGFTFRHPELKTALKDIAS